MLTTRFTVAFAAVLSLACGALPAPPAADPVQRWGFTAPWDPRSAVSVAEHGRELDAIVSGWITLDSLTGAPSSAYVDSTGRRGEAFRRMALVTTYTGSRFHPELVRRLTLDSLALARSASAVTEWALRFGYRGLVLDFEGMTGADSSATRTVVSAMSRSARNAGIGPIVVAVPASDTAGYSARLFDESADLLLVMLYDEHWTTSPPGAIASPDWVRRTLAMRVAERGASRLVAALPLYGYLWRPNAIGEAIGYDDARRLATEAGTSLSRDPATATLHASRPGADGWELWVSDATLLAELERSATAVGVRRVAYWRLGLEDPAIWAREVLARNAP